MTALIVWWHRVVLRHTQQQQINGATEPGVWCFCDWQWIPPNEPPARPRWFPSDGGHGR